MNNVKALKTISMIPLGLAMAILLLFTVGESASGDWSGLGHLIYAVPIGLLMWLGWRRPLWGGILLFFLAVLASINFSDALRGQGWLAPFLIIIAPLLLSGLILLIAAGLERKAT
jgi:hypothetical protein